MEIEAVKSRKKMSFSHSHNNVLRFLVRRLSSTLAVSSLGTRLNTYFLKCESFITFLNLALETNVRLRSFICFVFGNFIYIYIIDSTRPLHTIF